jgi:hypothetical protein
VKTTPRVVGIWVGYTREILKTVTLIRTTRVIDLGITTSHLVARLDEAPQGSVVVLLPRPCCHVPRTTNLVRFVQYILRL